MEIELLTNNCCDQLLQFQSDPKIRGRYDAATYPEEFIENVNFSTKYKLDEYLELSPKPENDVESSIAIFNQLSGLDRVQANDRRLWVSLTHGKFFSYTKNRWNYNKEYSDEAILRRFHFEGSSLETRMRNSISRLWWAARITYDENRKDPFELTRILWSKQDLIQNVVERSYGTYENVVKGILETYKDNPGLSESELRSLYTGMNSIGGVKVLSFLNVSEVKHELKKIAEYKEISLS
jgi:uncharacterized protein DUF6339